MNEKAGTSCSSITKSNILVLSPLLHFPFLLSCQLLDQASFLAFPCQFFLPPTGRYSHWSTVKGNSVSESSHYLPALIMDRISFWGFLNLFLISWNLLVYIVRLYPKYTFFKVKKFHYLVLLNKYTWTVFRFPQNVLYRFLFPDEEPIKTHT